MDSNEIRKERSLSGRPQPAAASAGHQESADPFQALASAGARDGEVRRYFAAILDAQDLPEQQRDEIWRAFLALGDAPASARGR